MNINAAYEWKCQPEAEGMQLRFLEQCCQGNHFIRELQEDLLRQTSTRLFDWIDHFIVGTLLGREEQFEKLGFVLLEAGINYRVFHHPEAQLPRIVLRDDNLPSMGIAISVECIADFLMVRGMHRWIEGESLSGYRRCGVSTEGEISLWVIERRGVTGMEPTYPAETHVESYVQSVEKWKARPRNLEHEDENMQYSIDLATDLVSVLGRDMAAWVVLECERSYWQCRNSAAQLQKNRQDRLGMGWANHDHHTFRSSRRHFVKLVRLFETLGFHCRERFWAGAEAGWGAQIMENPNCRLVLFLDVDLNADEIAIDFAHHPLPVSEHLGTIGLWCELHGDSILKAGMHHLEAQFMFEDLTQDLGDLGVGMMQPFSNFPYLRQAFTKGEIWPVDPQRVKMLENEKRIGKEQGAKFIAEGALGSHLENLQRREGYKGFNQKNVSFIIKRTDPRLS